MTTNIIPLSDYRPHLSITTQDGTIHIIPHEFFQEVIDGTLQITQLVGYEEIIPIIIKEWIENIK